MSFGVVSWIGRGMGVLVEVEIVEGEKADLGENVRHPVETMGTLWHSCTKLHASMWYCDVDVAYSG